VDKNVEVTVIEHVHPTERIEQVHRHDEGIEKRIVVERDVIPENKVEVHKHVHPVEKVDIHEHHKQKELEVVKEHVHQTHVKEVHEHVRPEVQVAVDKEIVHPEKVYETHKDVNLGETKRTVVDRELGVHESHRIGKDGTVVEVDETSGKHHHHDHHHHKDTKH